MSFKLAWEVSWGEILFPHSDPGRMDWRVALEWAQPEFEAAYQRERTAVAGWIEGLAPLELGARLVPAEIPAGVSL